MFQVLRRPEYFGKYGKIVKIVINPNTNYAGPQVHHIFTTYILHKKGVIPSIYVHANRK